MIKYWVQIVDHETGWTVKDDVRTPVAWAATMTLDDGTVLDRLCTNQVFCRFTTKEMVPERVDAKTAAHVRARLAEEG